MIDRWLDALAAFCLRRSKQILIASAILGILAIGAASRLRFDADLLNLVPQNNRDVNNFKKVLAQMGTIDYHIVVLEVPKGRDPGDYESLIEDVASGYGRSPLIEEVNYRIPNPVDLIPTILPKALLFLTPAELEQVGRSLSDQGIREAVARNRGILQSPQSSAMKVLVQYDPFNLLPIFLTKFKAAGGDGFRLDLSSGYYVSEDRSTILILTKPRQPAHDFLFAQNLTTAAGTIESAALQKFRTSSPEIPPPTISYTGGYTIALGDAELIKKDIIINVLGSFFGVLGLFIYGFRRLASVGYAALPMALGLAMTFGLAGMLYGVLSSMSAGFAALLAGLGIDFITVIYGRYVDERNRGEEMEDSIRTTMRTTMPGVFVAAITTAGTFLAFRATEFRGMTQFGSLTGTGIVFFLLAVMFLLPALIIQGEKRLRGRQPKLFLHSFGSEHLIESSFARPRLVIGLWVVFIVVCSALATRLRFSDNIQDLRAKGNPGVISQEKLTKKFGQSFDFMMYVVEDKNLDQVISKTYSASRDLDALVRNGSIASYQSISTFLPPIDQQGQIIARLQNDPNGNFSVPRIDRTFRQALVESGFRPDAYDTYLPLFHRALTAKEPISPATLNDPEIAKFTGRFLKKLPVGFMSVTYLYPTGGRWPRDVPRGLMEFAERRPETILTGVNLVSQNLRRIVRADAARATILGFITVLVLMIFSFRSAKMVILSFVPFVAGVVGMLGLMAAFNLEFNFMNVFVGLMIIGCATDYAIYMLQRYREDPATFAETAPETGKAVVMAAMTTIVGYGSFAISHFPGLRSIGYASTFGIGLSGLAAITLLPAILKILMTRSDKALQSATRNLH